MFALELTTFILSVLAVLGFMLAAIITESLHPLAAIGGGLLLVATFVLQPIIYQHFDDLRASHSPAHTKTYRDHGVTITITR